MLTDSSRWFHLCLLLLSVVALTACQTADESPTPGDGEMAPASQDARETYGETVMAERVLPVRTLLDSARALEGQEVVVKGRIAHVCQKKGCWLAMDAGDARPVRVLVPRTEEGYGFTVPKDASGEAVVSGTLSVNLLDNATRDHYESDGAVRPDSVEVQIAARGIEIAP